MTTRSPSAETAKEGETVFLFQEMHRQLVLQVRYLLFCQAMCEYFLGILWLGVRPMGSKRADIDYRGRPVH